MNRIRIAECASVVVRPPKRLRGSRVYTLPSVYEYLRMSVAARSAPLPTEDS